MLLHYIKVKNPFHLETATKEEVYHTGRETLNKFVKQDDLHLYFLNGNEVKKEDFKKTYISDDDYLVEMPAIGGGDFFKSFLSFVAMAALAWFAGSIVATGKLFGLAHATLGTYLAAGAVMMIGSRIINAIFPQDVPSFEFGQSEQQNRAYTWNLPTLSSASGNVIGETFGECIPAGQLLLSHITTENNVQYLNVLVSGGYGPVDEISDIRLDNTPIDNFSEVQSEVRYGTNNQEPISFFKETPQDVEVNLQLKEASPIVRSTPTNRCKDLSVLIDCPSGLYHVNDEGNNENLTVTFKIEYKKSGAAATTFVEVGTYSLTGNTSDEITKEYRWQAPVEDKYDVRVTLISAPHTNRDVSTVVFKYITAYLNQAFSHPNQVLLGFKIRATNQLSGNLPNITWKQKRNNVLVYNPRTKTYEEKRADNPIWAAYDILHHCRKLYNINTDKYEYVVLGCKHECLDKYYPQWESAALYADDMILNNENEYEKRFLFDYFYGTELKRYDAAQRAATVGHSCILIHGNYYGIITDKPASISQIFTNGNITKSTIQGSFNAKEDRARSVEITYNDSENDFKNTQFCLRSPYFNQDDDNTAKLTLYGVKRRTQAFREGIRALATNERQLQTLDLQTDINGICCEYGDVVGYSSEVSNIGVASGRIEKLYKDGSILVDTDPAYAENKEYQIKISHKDGNIQTRKLVINYKNNIKRVMPKTPFDPMPEKYDVYTIGEVERVVKPFRVVGAKLSGDLKVTLKLIEYDEAVYADDWDYTNYPDINYSATLPYTDVITSITGNVNYYTAINGAVSADLIVSFNTRQAYVMPERYLVIATDSSGKSIQVQTLENSVTIPNVKIGETYTVEVKCIYNVARVGTHSIKVHVHGKSTSPASISNLVLTISNSYIHATWNYSTSKDVEVYRVYYGMNGASLENCTLYKSTASNTCSIPFDKAGAYIVYVQAVDGFGNVSSTVSETIYISLPSGVLNLNAKVNYTEFKTNEQYNITVTYTQQEPGNTADVYISDDDGETYKYVGTHASNVTTPLLGINKTYLIKVQAKNSYFKCDSANIKYTSIKIVSQSPMPNTPTNFVIKLNNNKLTGTWNIVDNVAIEYYELRYDTNVGSDTNLIGRTQGNYYQFLSLKNRTAKVYLYAHSYAGKDSLPTSYQCNFPTLPAPDVTKIEINIKFKTLTVKVPLIEAAMGVRIRITSWDLDVQRPDKYFDQMIDCPNGVLTINLESDIYYVYACYYDILGDGAWTDYPKTAVIDPYFDPAYIEDGTISMQKFDKQFQNEYTTLKDVTVPALNTRIQEVDAEAGRINEKAQGIIDELNKEPSVNGYKSIQKLVTKDGELESTIANNKTTQDGINATHLSQIQQNASGITTIVGNLNKSASGNTYSAISSLSQRADSISSTVATNKTNQDKVNESHLSQIQQNASGITTIVGNLNKSASGNAYSAISSLSQRADSISSTVTTNKTTQDGINSNFTSSITQHGNSINAIVSNLNDKPTAYSGLSLMNDAINLRVQKGDVINQINLTPTGTTIDGKYLHVTGSTLFDDNVIVSKMLKAGAVTADKLAADAISADKINVDKLSSLSATIGTLRTKTSGARVEIHDNLIEVFDANGKLRCKLGIW